MLKVKLFICCINNLKMFQVSIWLERNTAEDPAAGKAEERRYSLLFLNSLPRWQKCSLLFTKSRLYNAAIPTHLTQLWSF